MKSIKKLPALFIALCLTIAFTACQKNPIAVQSQPDMNELQSQIPVGEDQGEIKFTAADISQHKHEAINHLNSLGVNLDNPIRETEIRPDGSVDEVYTIGEDIEVSPETYKKLLEEQANPLKQYSTNYLVSTPRTIRLGVELGGSSALPAPFLIAASMAAGNYNNLGLGISFVVYPVMSNLPNQPEVDILMYYVPTNTKAGGKAGFSSNSDPYPYIKIYGGMAAYLGNMDVLEHLVTHEIGHCIGMRHTDWQTRTSCGQSTNEGTGNYGANHIAGTPAAYYHLPFFGKSVMNACFSSSSTGEFDLFDQIALTTLY